MEYGPVPHSRFDEVILFLRKNFHDEPLNVSVQLCIKDVPSPLFEDYNMKTLKDGFSLLATDPSTGEIAGVILNGISSRGEVEEEDEHIRTVNDIPYQRIFGLLNNLNKKANLYDKFNIDKIFELRILSVDSKYRGKGIAKQLFIRSENVAIEAGCKLLKTDATSYITQKVAESQGYVTAESVRYGDFKDENGDQIYNVKSPHDYYKIMIKEIPQSTKPDIDRESI